ncbi:oligosaccharide flippase family protein [Deinococcus aetherius]|uniref:oligosaccharide flippase family protein n=1 Tax=Deinococcus aetherius TaxID=200252 RepID=UPI0022309DF2|nr:polysaccharide biosynthesis C-terminal domain-containing protein [Deinococcus aetherius]
MWSFTGLLGRFVLQTFSFILIASELGPSGFGTFSAALALTLVLAPFVEMGAYAITVRDSKTPHLLATSLGTTLKTTSVLLPVAILVLTAASYLALKELNLILTILLGLGVFVGMRFMYVAQAVNASLSKFSRNAVFDMGLSLALLIGAFSVKLIGSGKVDAWFLMYASIYGVVGFLFFLFTTRAERIRIGAGGSWNAIVERLREGWTFAFGGMAQSAYSELDKTILLNLAGAPAVGRYSMAVRLIQVSYMPINALLNVTFPKMFRLMDSNEVGALSRYLLKIILTALVYSVLCVLTLQVLAPLLPNLFGEEYASSTHLLKLIALAVVLQGVYWPILDALTAMGFQKLRMIITFGGVAANVTLNLILIPSMKEYGAVVSYLASQLILLVVASVLIVWSTKRMVGKG